MENTIVKHNILSL